MNGHVIAHGNDFTGPIENRARIIAAFFDIRRKRSAAKRGAHFLRDRVIDVLENFEFNGIARHFGGESVRQPVAKKKNTECRIMLTLALTMLNILGYQAYP